MVKFEHTVFALPFAIGGALLAANGLPDFLDLMLILLAAIFARTAAMAFNRLVDRDVDASNPRTHKRELVTGELAVAWTWGFTFFCAAAFIASAFLLAPICGYLSIPVLVILCGYSLLKRFTLLCHFGLGFALACAPAGAWLAVNKEFSGGWDLPLWIGAGVLLWVAGFDLLYAIQDIAHDRKNGLHSLPSRLGIERTRLLAGLLHLGALAMWWNFGTLAKLEIPFYFGLAGVAGILSLEHFFLRGNRIERIPAVFFNLNAWVGPVWLLGFIFSLPPNSGILTG